MIVTMLSRRAFGVGLAVALAAAPLAHAAEPPTAKAFLDGIYKTYVGKDAAGVPLDKPASYRRYFTPSVVAIILKDQAVAAKSGDVPTLDGDAFIGAQDWDVANLAIDVQEAGDKATATVTFTNSGEAQKVGVSLVRVAKEWRIDDVTWPDGSTLRGLYKK